MECAPVSYGQLCKVLLVSEEPSGHVAGPFEVGSMEVWENLLAIMIHTVPIEKYNFRLERFLYRSTVMPDTFNDMVLFYGSVTRRDLRHFVRHTMFSVRRKRTHDELFIQYYTYFQPDNLMEFTIHLPLCYDPRLFLLVGFLLMLRCYNFVLDIGDVVSNLTDGWHGAHDTKHHNPKDYFDLVFSRGHLDVLDLAFLKKYSPKFLYPTPGSLVHLALHSIDSRVGVPPFVGRHSCDQETSQAFPDDDMGEISFEEFYKDYDPISALIARIGVNFA
jgi:hypothetical protein